MGIHFRPSPSISIICRSGETGRRAGLKIQWTLRPCRFDSDLRHQRKHPQRALNTSERLPAQSGRKPFYFSVWAINLSYAREQSLVEVIKAAVGHDEHDIPFPASGQQRRQQGIRVRKTMGLKPPFPEIRNQLPH